MNLFKRCLFLLNYYIRGGVWGEGDNQILVNRMVCQVEHTHSARVLDGVTVREVEEGRQ